MPIAKNIRQATRNKKNKNLAIPAAVAAIPVNPKRAATNAMIRKIKAQRSILSPPSESNRIGRSSRAFFSDELRMGMNSLSVPPPIDFPLVFPVNRSFGSVITKRRTLIMQSFFQVLLGSGTELKKLTFLQVSLRCRPSNKSETSLRYVLFVNYEHNSLNHSHSIVDWSLACLAV
jgi:hypothetical protein